LAEDTSAVLLARPLGKKTDFVLETGLSQGGTLVFDSLSLDGIWHEVKDGAFQFVLQGDGMACPNQPFGPNIRIDCSGPAECDVVSLHDTDVIKAVNDADSTTPGMQLQIVVQTSDDARGQPVNLIINDGPPVVSTVAVAGAAKAVFMDVSLP